MRSIGSRNRNSNKWSFIQVPRFITTIEHLERFPFSVRLNNNGEKTANTHAHTTDRLIVKSNDPICQRFSFHWTLLISTATYLFHAACDACIKMKKENILPVFFSSSLYLSASFHLYFAVALTICTIACARCIAHLCSYMCAIFSRTG